MSDNRIYRDYILNNLISTSVLKVPVYQNLSVIGDNSGMRGDVILNNSDDTFYGHNGITWIPFSGGGPPSIENLQQTLTVGNFTGGENMVINNGDSIILEGTIDIQTVGNLLTPSNQTGPLSSGYVKITGFSGIPNGNPSVIGGELAWNQLTNELYIHSGSGLWIPITESMTNIGAGAQIYRTTSQNPFELRSLVSSDPRLILTENLDTISFSLDIDLSGSGILEVQNYGGSGATVYDESSPPEVAILRRITSTDGTVSVTENPTNIDLSVQNSSFEVVNKDVSGVRVYDESSPPNIAELRRLISSDNSLSIVQNPDTIDLTVSFDVSGGILDLQNIGNGEDIYNTGTAPLAQIRRLIGSTSSRLTSGIQTEDVRLNDSLSNPSPSIDGNKIGCDIVEDLEIVVSSSGNDDNDGITSPVASIDRAFEIVRYRGYNNTCIIQLSEGIFNVQPEQAHLWSSGKRGHQNNPVELRGTLSDPIEGLISDVIIPDVINDDGIYTLTVSNPTLNETFIGNYIVLEDASGNQESSLIGNITSIGPGVFNIELPIKFYDSPVQYAIYENFTTITLSNSTSIIGNNSPVIFNHLNIALINTPSTELKLISSFIDYNMIYHNLKMITNEIFDSGSLVSFENSTLSQLYTSEQRPDPIDPPTFIQGAGITFRQRTSLTNLIIRFNHSYIELDCITIETVELSNFVIDLNNSNVSLRNEVVLAIRYLINASYSNVHVRNSRSYNHFRGFIRTNYSDIEVNNMTFLYTNATSPEVSESLFIFQFSNAFMDNILIDGSGIAIENNVIRSAESTLRFDDVIIQNLNTNQTSSEPCMIIDNCDLRINRCVIDNVPNVGCVIDNSRFIIDMDNGDRQFIRDSNLNYSNSTFDSCFIINNSRGILRSENSSSPPLVLLESTGSGVTNIINLVTMNDSSIDIENVSFDNTSDITLQNGVVGNNSRVIIKNSNSKQPNIIESIMNFTNSDVVLEDSILLSNVNLIPVPQNPLYQGRTNVGLRNTNGNLTIRNFSTIGFKRSAIIAENCTYHFEDLNIRNNYDQLADVSGVFGLYPVSGISLYNAKGNMVDPRIISIVGEFGSDNSNEFLNGMAIYMKNSEADILFTSDIVNTLYISNVCTAFYLQESRVKCSHTLSETYAISDDVPPDASGNALFKHVVFGRNSDAILEFANIQSATNVLLDTSLFDVQNGMLSLSDVTVVTGALSNQITAIQSENCKLDFNRLTIDSTQTSGIHQNTGEVIMNNCTIRNVSNVLEDATGVSIGNSNIQMNGIDVSGCVNGIYIENSNLTADDITVNAGSGIGIELKNTSLKINTLNARLYQITGMLCNHCNGVFENIEFIENGISGEAGMLLENNNTLTFDISGSPFEINNAGTNYGIKFNRGNKIIFENPSGSGINITANIDDMNFPSAGDTSVSELDVYEFPEITGTLPGSYKNHSVSGNIVIDNTS